MQGGSPGENSGEDSSGEARRSQCASGQGENGQAARAAAQAEALGQEDSSHPNGLCPRMHQIPSGPYLAHLSFGSSTGQWASCRWRSRFPTLEKGHLTHSFCVCFSEDGSHATYCPSLLIVGVTLGGTAAIL